MPKKHPNLPEQCREQVMKSAPKHSSGQYLSLVDGERARLDSGVWYFLRNILPLKTRGGIEEIKKQAEENVNVKALVVESASLPQILATSFRLRLRNACSKERKIADQYEHVSVLFIDIVGLRHFSKTVACL